MYVCVYARAHTHTGYSVVSLRVGIRHLKDLNKPDGPNLRIHIFVYVYKSHMFMYMLGGRMRSLTNCFFLQHYFTFKKEKQKMLTQTTDNLKSTA